MYQFSGKLKIIAIVLMVIGALGIGYGFFTGSSKTLEDAKETIAHQEELAAKKAEEAKMDPRAIQYGSHKETTEAEEHNAAHDTVNKEEHEAHVLNQLKNRPWAAFFVSLFFFFMIALLIFAFYVIQIAASAGWSVVLFRVMEGLSANLIPLGIIMFIFLLASALGMNHFYPWMHAEGDAIIEGKSWWLNIPGWIIRAGIYIVGYIFFRYIIRKKSVEQDNASDFKAHEKGFKYSIMFLAFFMLSESALSWDWIMSLDPHWFSTLFAWYIFASAIVSAITVIALVTMYLKSKGYLEFVNDSHLHDLGVYMFGFSIFWTYLWFAQYMLIWYANMPEETTYFAQRLHDYNFIFYLMVALNFAFPVLILMDTEWKRKFGIVTIVGLVILVGHYIDVFVMIMPSTVGAQWGFGFTEIGALLFFIGLFIFTGFSSMAKQPLLAKGNPYLKESEDYHN
jgi:hypothetical protein